MSTQIIEVDVYVEEPYELAKKLYVNVNKEILNIAKPQKGDLCRICSNIGENGNNSEYVYFEMP